MLLNLIANFILRAYILHLCILCSSAFSLTLGNLKLYSSLNQPLKASIEILNADDLYPNEILPNLASVDDFQLANLVRPDFLSNMECEVITNNKNNKVIFISTATPIKHPSIELLIEVHWPEGRILKEYSILLAPGHTTPPAHTLNKETPIHKKVSPPLLKIQNTKINKYDSYYTKKGETLWSIANMVAKKRDLSVKQSMDLIFKMNPSAFIDGDRTKLQANFKLKLPHSNNNLNSDMKYNSDKTTKESITFNKSQSSNIHIKNKNNNQTDEKKSISQKNIDIPTASVNAANNLAKENTNTNINTELAATNSTQQIPTANKNQTSKIVTNDTSTNYEVTQEASIANAKQQQKDIQPNESTQNDKLSRKEKLVAKKIDPLLIKDNYFLNIYTLIIILLICGFGFILYRKQKKSKHKTSQEPDLNNGVVIDDYSQVKPENNTNKKTQDKNDIPLDLTPIERAEEFIAQNEPHKAILILNQAISINPTDPDINFKLTELYCNIKDRDNARKMMTNSLQLNNSNLNTKLESLKKLFPNLFIKKAIEDEDGWGIDNLDSNIDDMSSEEQAMISDISRSSKEADDLSFLEDSELSAEDTMDEIFKDTDTSGEYSKNNSPKPQNSKLDLAKGYIDIGDNIEARKLLNEITTSGTEKEQQEAQQLLSNLEENNPN